MYRYLLFHCPYYYPSGGMKDCIFKTNNRDELRPFINKNLTEPYLNSIHYYDTVEDKIIYALMDEYEDEDGFTKQKFMAWSEVEI